MLFFMTRLPHLSAGRFVPGTFFWRLFLGLLAGPVRVDLATGKIRVLKMEEFKGKGRAVPGGAATVLDLPLDATKELKSLTVRTLANQVVIGLMSVTLAR
jgi:hypothetical protein